MIDQVFSIYRDSDSSWPVYPLGYLCTEVKKKNKLLFEENLLSLSYGRIKRKDIESTEGLLPESFDGYNIVESGDVVLRLTDLQNDVTLSLFSAHLDFFQSRILLSHSNLILFKRRQTPCVCISSSRTMNVFYVKYVHVYFTASKKDPQDHT
jgi:hypothetical protein